MNDQLARKPWLRGVWLPGEAPRTIREMIPSECWIFGITHLRLQYCDRGDSEFSRLADFTLGPEILGLTGVGVFNVGDRAFREVVTTVPARVVDEICDLLLDVPIRAAHRPWKTYLQYQGTWTLEVSIGDQAIILSTNFKAPQYRVWSIVFNGMRWTTGSILPMALIHALDPWLSRMPLHQLTQELRARGEADRPA